LDRQIARFFEQLGGNYGISVQTAEDALTDFRAVAAAAEKIWSMVLLEVMDAFIYSSAVISMADIIITRDSPFL